MLKKLFLFLIAFFLIISVVFSGMTFLYFALPSRVSSMTIHLPDTVEDDPSIVKANNNTTEENQNNAIYLADVHQSLTLRSEPDSKAESIVDLSPMTHMKLLEFVENTNFAYVEVQTGEYYGYTGYVNKDYITLLGEQTIRVGEER